VESGWRQFDSSGRPLVSGDFGYGIMQITSGMAGAFHDVRGSIDPGSQSRIASDYTYNVAEGAAALAFKYTATPRIGDGSPDTVEHWYYALWAYNGWGWVNNPNNPRFTRQGTPASDPSSFPYQERVLYLVAHPPRDSDGNPLWQPVRVSLPARSAIGKNPGPLAEPHHPHSQHPLTLAAVEQAAHLPPMPAGSTRIVALHLTNTGTQAWAATTTDVVAAGYHLFNLTGNPWRAISPFTPGIIAYGQGTVPLSRDVLPGQSIVIRLGLRAPDHPGTYRVVWDLVEGLSTWFSQAGSWPRTQVLRVYPPGQTVPTPTPRPPATPSLQENLRFVADTSIPDGTVLRAHERFDKGWLVFNSGSTTWGAGWALQVQSARAFGARRIDVPVTPPCHSANIVVRLHAPAHGGRVEGIWQLRDPTGHTVGSILTVVVRIGHGPPTPTPEPTRVPTPISASPTPTPVG